MTNQTDIKKLAEQMAGSMKSFDDIKDFQKQLRFLNTLNFLNEQLSRHMYIKKYQYVISQYEHRLLFNRINQ